jgi:hypothetical protein
MQDHASRQTALEPLYLNRADAAGYLSKRFGFRCSEQTLAKLAVKGQGAAVQARQGQVCRLPGGELGRMGRHSNS